MMKKLSLTSQIAIALVLAVIAGILLQDYADFVNDYIKPLGSIFLNLLKFIVVPLVLFSIMAGILSMNDVSKVGRLGLRALFYFMFTTVIAVALGLVVSTLAKGYLPLIHVDTGSSTPEVEIPDLTIMDQIVNMFPQNIMLPLTNMTMMQVIVIALFFGVAMVHVGEPGEPLRKLTLSANVVVSKILTYIMALAPYGVFCMLTPVVVSNGPSVLGSYAVLVALGYSCFTLHAVCVYGSLVYLLGGMSPIKFFKGLRPAMLFAFSSDSSVATLPYTMECTEKLGVRRDIGNFVLSLGATINIDTVDGPYSYTIKPGTQTDTRIRLKNKGVPSLRNKNLRGNHFVTFVVQVPEHLTAAQKEALRNFQVAMGEIEEDPSKNESEKSEKKGFFGGKKKK